MKQRINDYVNQKHQDHLKLMEQVETVRDMVNLQMAQVEEGLCSILDVLDTTTEQDRKAKLNSKASQIIEPETPKLLSKPLIDDDINKLQRIETESDDEISPEAEVE